MPHLPSVHDDGDPPERWEDTSMKQEFEVIVRKFNLWQEGFKSEFPNNDFTALVRVTDMTLDALNEHMTGRL